MKVIGVKKMKRRSRLRSRVREWLRKRKTRKEEEKALPSIINHHHEHYENTKEFYYNENPTEE